MTNKERVISYLNDRLKDYALSKEIDSELVYGNGNCDSRIVLVGEAPGYQEVVEKKPFVGKAGKNLDEFLEFTGIRREEVYITNVVKFRPTTLSRYNNLVNRTPTENEISLFSPFLYKEIETIEPELIVTLGNTPLKALVKVPSTIGKVHGTLIDSKVMDLKLYALYHPASLIYNQSLKETYYSDLARLKTLLEKK